MLPQAIAACVARYKGFEKAILSWVVSVSDSCGYKNVENPSKRNSIAFGSTASHATSDAKKYTVPGDEILPRVAQIVTFTRPPVQVPTYIIKYLRQSIADRERCNSWFQDCYAADVYVDESTDTHVYFTETLKSMLRMLDTIALEPSELSQPRGLPRSKSSCDLKRETDPKPRYADLRSSGQVEDLESTEEEKSDSGEGSTTTVAEDERDFQIVTEKKAESTDSTHNLRAIYDVLRRLRQLRDYVEDIWNSYREEHIGLLHATVITNAAIDCAADLEHKIDTIFPESADWGDLVDVFFPEVTAHWRNPHSTLSAEKIQAMDLVFLAPTMLLKTFLEMDGDGNGAWDTTWLQTWLPEVNKVYDPRVDGSKLSSQERLDRHIVFLHSMIPELALHTQLQVRPTKDKVIAGFTDLLATRRLRLWVVFSFAVFCDIHLVLGDDMLRPFKDMQQQLERARKENHDYVENTENTLMAGNRPELNQKDIQCRDEIMTEDIMMRSRSPVLGSSKYALHAQKPFFLFSHHPLLCGSEALSFRLSWQRQAIDLVDLWMHMSAALHLFSALKHQGCLAMSVPFLDGLQDTYGIERIFFGNPPSDLQTYTKHYKLVLGYSIKWFASDKRKGAPIQSARSKYERIRDLRTMRPLLKRLEKTYSCREDERLSQWTKLKEMVRKHRSSRQPGISRTTPRTQWDNVLSDPMAFLPALSEWLQEEQPQLDFDFYRAHNVCWKLLRRIEASPRVQKKFREAYDVEGSTVDHYLKYIPVFIFERQVEDPKGQWMQSVGETVAKFFREIPTESLLPISIPESLEDPTSIRYAKGYKLSEDIHHPEKNKRCCHIGVCALQVVHWRLQAGLGPWEEDDVDGAWWHGLRADLTEEEESKTTASHRQTPAPAPQTITAEEIVRLIPHEGLGMPEVVTHFKGRLHKAQLNEFSTLLASVTKYNRRTKIFTPLSTEEKDGRIATHDEIPSRIPLTIAAAEIQDFIPPEGLSILHLVVHFKERLHKAQMKEFGTLLRSVVKYDPVTSKVTVLK
ncbi:MAG: hypothetical protein Q9168_000128 [Polycauliona sp. 1 TL-2023]